MLEQCIEIPVHISDNRFVGIVLGYVLNHQHYALGTVELFLGIVVELKEELDLLEHLVQKTDRQVRSFRRLVKHIVQIYHIHNHKFI